MSKTKIEPFSESDTRAKLITPALHQCGWVEEMIRREETPGEIFQTENGIQRGRKKMDYLLRVPKPQPGFTPVPIALVEAKKNTAAAASGMEQAKGYARRFNVPFVYSTNGYLFVEYDTTTGRESYEQAMEFFPTPNILRQRYEKHVNFSLSDEAAAALTAPYFGGENSRRYYQDAAIRAALEKIADYAKRKEPVRMLFNLATGAGKTFIAVNLLKKIFDAGGLRRALFLCDRDALRQQALTHFQDAFGSDAEVARRTADGGNQAKNARIHIATYQTLGISGDDEYDDLSFAKEHYPPDSFSHIIIDECHRSLRNGWAKILDDNKEAVHIGLTATPKQMRETNEEDREISSRNFEYFGEPVYVYSLAQGTEDGYLALCEIDKSDVDIDKTGLSWEEVMQYKPKNFNTGELLTEEEVKEMYEKKDYESILMLPDRVDAMCGDFFNKLVQNGNLKQKTIIFCVRSEHAQMVSSNLNNRYADWCKQNDKKAAEPYAFVCMSKQGGELLTDFRAEDSSHFVAVTVELLTTGVDIPAVRNIVFFGYVRSPIRLQQMIGRGSRIDESRNKLSFTVYDYTNATNLLDEENWVPRKPRQSDGERKTEKEIPTLATIEGLDVRIEQGEKLIIVSEGDGRSVRLNVEQYRQRMVQRLMEKIKTPDELRAAWIDPVQREDLLQFLHAAKCSPSTLAELLEKRGYDNYDILAESAYHLQAKTLRERAKAFHDENEKWLKEQPQNTGAVLRALVEQFAGSGIEELENPLVFEVRSVQKAGGRAALSEAGNEPSELLRETKRRLFAA